MFIFRSNMAGVHVADDFTISGDSIHLVRGRLCREYTGPVDLGGAAEVGFRTAKLSAPTDVILYRPDCCSIYRCSQRATDTINAIEPWDQGR